MIVELFLPLLGAEANREHIRNVFPLTAGDWYVGWRLDRSERPMRWIVSIALSGELGNSQRTWLDGAIKRHVITGYQVRPIALQER